MAYVSDIADVLLLNTLLTEMHSPYFLKWVPFAFHGQIIEHLRNRTHNI